MGAGLLRGGVALVTGAAGGLGSECVFSLAEGGASAIILADLPSAQPDLKVIAEKSKAFATSPQYRTLCLEVDLLDETKIQAMVDAAVNECGRLDYFIQSAGIDSRDYEDITEVTLSDYATCLDANVKGNLLVMKAVSRVMKKQEPQTITSRHGDSRQGPRGSILVVASANAYAPLPKKVAYVTAKHAVLGMVKSAALDLASHHVRVNAICPTWMRTPMFEAEQKKTPEILEIVKAVVPINRPAETEEVADVAVFLCSETANYVTGTGLVIDAGATLTVKMG